MLEKAEDIRIKKNYSYKFIADQTGFSRSYIWQLFHGTRRLSYEQAILIASVFNMKPDQLFYTDYTQKINNR